MLEGVEHGVVLGGAGDEVFAARSVAAGEAEDGEVIRFGAAAGEDDLVRAAAEERGELVAGIVERGAGLASGGVDGGGVAVVLLQVGAHGGEHLGGEGCGRVVVEVDHQIIQSSTTPPCWFLSSTFTPCASASTSERAGTLWMRKTLAPMVEPLPITVSPPMMVALA